MNSRYVFLGSIKVVVEEGGLEPLMTLSILGRAVRATY